MVDRTDIDALLIGALYGELPPADEARLTAHLESHPADRTALDDMARVRAAIRNSRILAAQVEPPHAISALLLQEAAHRGPRAAVAHPVDRESETWFQRFVRSFVAHPALAAAATVVLVASVAGGLYLRGDAQFAAPSAPATAGFERARPSEVAAAPAAPIAPAPEAPSASAPGGATGQLAAGSDGNRAQLDEATGDAPAQGRTAAAMSADDQLRKDDGAVARAKARAIAKLETDKARDPGSKEVALTRSRRSESTPPAKSDGTERKSAKPPRGIELRSPQLSPRDLFDEDVEDRDRRAKQAQPQPPAAAGASNQVAAAPAVPPPAAAPPPAPPPADAKPVREAAVLDWARKQHDQVVALVASNRCRDAATAAVEIYNRAPDYFAANIVTDRQIKPCLAYVNNERERAERSRGIPKNSAYDMPPAPAAPAPRK